MSSANGHDHENDNDEASKSPPPEPDSIALTNTNPGRPNEYGRHEDSDSDDDAALLGRNPAPRRPARGHKRTPSTRVEDEELLTPWEFVKGLLTEVSAVSVQYYDQADVCDRTQ